MKYQKARLGMLVIVCFCVCFCVACKKKTWTHLAMQKILVTQLPSCVTSEGKPGLYKENYYMLLNGKNHRGFARLGDSHAMLGTAQELTIKLSQPTTFAFISCVGSVDRNKVKHTKESSVPTVCKGQKVLLHKPIQVTQRDRALLFGFDGFLPFPKGLLKCKKGKPLVDDHRTLAQHLWWLQKRIEKVFRQTGQFPRTWKQIRGKGYPSLPTRDPWGTPLKLKAAPNKFELATCGPDRRCGTKDDQKLLWLGVQTGPQAYRRRGLSSFRTYKMKGFLCPGTKSYKACLTTHQQTIKTNKSTTSH